MQIKAVGWRLDLSLERVRRQHSWFVLTGGYRGKRATQVNGPACLQRGEMRNLSAYGPAWLGEVLGFFLFSFFSLYLAFFL